MGSDPVRSKIVVNNDIVEQVSSFNYLGCEMTYGYSNDVEQKLNKFNHICGTISRHLKNKTRKDTQVKFYKTIAVPTMLYGCECWILTERQRSRIQAQEMKFLRRVKGCTRHDRIRNDEVRKELKIFNINERIDFYRRKWNNHLERMKPERLPLKAKRYKCLGRRSVGRPRKRWVP